MLLFWIYGRDYFIILSQGQKTTFWLSTVYGQKLGPILQSTGFENAELQSTEKKYSHPSL